MGLSLYGPFIGNAQCSKKVAFSDSPFFSFCAYTNDLNCPSHDFQEDAHIYYRWLNSPWRMEQTQLLPLGDRPSKLLPTCLILDLIRLNCGLHWMNELTDMMKVVGWLVLVFRRMKQSESWSQAHGQTTDWLTMSDSLGWLRQSEDLAENLELF